MPRNGISQALGTPVSLALTVVFFLRLFVRAAPFALPPEGRFPIPLWFCAHRLVIMADKKVNIRFVLVQGGTVAMKQNQN